MFSVNTQLYFMHDP